MTGDEIVPLRSTLIDRGWQTSHSFVGVQSYSNSIQQCQETYTEYIGFVIMNHDDYPVQLRIFAEVFLDGKFLGYPSPFVAYLLERISGT